MQIEFPSSFLWGAALSSYQCEGGNYNSDWYLWEKQKQLTSAGIACDHYHLFDRDFQLARSLNLNSLRLSLEWARICPDSSSISAPELAHYVKVVDTLRKHGLKPIVTLHHFTNPVWFANSGGWLNPENVDGFLRFLKAAVESLKGKVDFWLIFNEPLVYIYNGFVQGCWPPGKSSLRLVKKVVTNMVAAYCQGYQEIKNIYRQAGLTAQVSLAKHTLVFSGCPGLMLPFNSFTAFCRSKIFNFRLLDYLEKKRCLDFIALNYYCKYYSRFGGLLGRECSHGGHKERRNSLDWSVYPQGIYAITKILKKFGLPILVTENGTSEIDERFYRDFLLSHLKNLHRALTEGADVIGYLWWSLLDNFEWDKGYQHRFGLIEVDYYNLKRRIKPFAYTYAKICKENKLSL